jgi:hypothetical protein
LVQGVGAMLQLNFRSDLKPQAFSIDKPAWSRISLQAVLEARQG